MGGKPPSGCGLPPACPSPHPTMLLSSFRNLKRLLHIGISQQGSFAVLVIDCSPLSSGLGAAGLVSMGRTIAPAQPSLAPFATVCQRTSDSSSLSCSSSTLAETLAMVVLDGGGLGCSVQGSLGSNGKMFHGDVTVSPCHCPDELSSLTRQ